MSEFEHTGVLIPRFWRDFRGKSLEVKALAAFLVTGRHNIGLPGCCEVSLVTMAEELEVTTAQLDRLMAELPAGFAQYDRVHRVLRVPNAPRIGHRPNHQVIRAWWRAWKALPESGLKYDHIESLRDSLSSEPTELQSKTWHETFDSVVRPMGQTEFESAPSDGCPTHPRPQSRPQSQSLFPDPERAGALEAAGEEAGDKSAPMREVVDAWYARYEERTGFKPTWPKEQKGKIFGSLKRLIGAVGAPEVCRRIGILFDAPPSFLAESVPDVATLVQHFDKLAAAAEPRKAAVRQLTTRSGQSAMSPNQMAERARKQLELEHQERQALAEKAGGS